jgi:hypothetical protein
MRDDVIILTASFVARRRRAQIWTYLRVVEQLGVEPGDPSTFHEIGSACLVAFYNSLTHFFLLS